MTLDLFQKEEQHTNGPVTVLGKTFANNEERRAYFREELRKKLPELKEIEGFPIGEDEDIINLSDPPYYTACPNPWINDFITEWEEEKKQLEKEGKRVPDFEVTEPYAADVSEGKNNPIYNAHSYHTKVPHPAIMRYIMHYTQPGDVVFDGFAGTGMTGVAASMCANPDADIKAKIEKENPNVKWGKRNAICGDLSPVASIISYNFNSVSFKVLEKDINSIISKVWDKVAWMYETIHNEAEYGEIDNTIWSDVFLCQNCNSEIIYWNAVVDYENKTLNSEVIECEVCGHISSKRNLVRAFVSVYDTLLNEVKQEAKVVPVFIEYSYKGKRYKKKPEEFDLDLLRKIEIFEASEMFLPSSRMMEGGEARRNDKIGITHTHHYYTRRNFLTLAYLYKEIENNPHFTKFISVLTASVSRATHTNRFRFGGTGGLSGTLYIPSLRVERSAIPLLKSKARDLYKAEKFKTWNDQYCVTTCQSATHYSNLLDNSVDYIFTDPPFGANISYSELNFITSDWIKLYENLSYEAIENSSHNKDFLYYINLMSLSFANYFRLLKPGKWMTVEFSNTSAAVWNGIQTAIQSAGFIVSNVSGLDRKQGSFKTVTTATAVKQDLVISCYKPSSEFDTKFQQSQHSAIGVWDFVEEHLSHLPIHLVKENSTTAIIERSAKILFDRLIAFYVQRSLPVPIDAGKFQEGLKERFVERDGMYFTQEQVEEYERKKAEVPEFIQMSLFVGSEQDAVYWLRQLLEKEHRTESDLHPLWMREVAGNMRKGDTLPEMRQILEENFLKDESGKWYVPDAENEADLEKLRNKRLLKIFEEYKVVAAKPKGKLKEVRVEALRVGFKQCYQDKDFKTIVSIGDRIPNNLLMEDEVLLQFYDIASAKI